MKIVGIIKSVAPLRKGTTEKGEWRSIDFVIEEVNKEFPESAMLRCRGAMADKVFSMVALTGSIEGLWEASFTMRVRTFTNKNGETATVTDLNCWKLEPAEAGERSAS